MHGSKYQWFAAQEAGKRCCVQKMVLCRFFRLAAVVNWMGIEVKKKACLQIRKYYEIPEVTVICLFGRLCGPG